MIGWLLILILGVLLFGASSVLGALGVVLGILFVGLALIALSIMLGVSPLVVIFSGFLVFVAFLVWAQQAQRRMDEEVKSSEREARDRDIRSEYLRKELAAREAEYAKQDAEREVLLAKWEKEQ